MTEDGSQSGSPNDGQHGGVPSLRPAQAQANARADGLDQHAAGLAAFIAAHADGQPAAGDAAARARAVDLFSDRLAAGTRAAGRRRQLVLGAGMAAALALAVTGGLMARGLVGRAPVALSYTVDGAVPPTGGYVRSAPAHEPVLAFSDGTRIRMMPSARARVLELDQHGARVVLEEGRAHVEVAHRPEADWQIQAGAFLIHVHGTAFFVDWNAELSRLDVRMESGVVSVDGPGPGDSVVLRAGQTLSRSLRGEVAAAATTTSLAPAPVTAAVPAADLEAPPAASEAPPAAMPTPRAGTGARPAPAPSWPEKLAQGQSAAIVAEAERRGLARVLAGRSSEDLAALADAARYRGRDGLARRALLAQRRRFPGTARAEEASFLLGRLDDRPAGDAASALGWYDRYLGDAPRGTYAAEALGRKMTVLRRQHRDAQARAIAADYLRRFPGGTYAHAARALVTPAP